MPFTLCPACRLPSERLFSALPCEECLTSLLLPPPICPLCFGFACGESPEECLRDWIRVDGGDSLPYRLRSVIAAYASIGPGSRVLKVWKTSQNRSLDRVLLAGVRRAVRTWQNEEELSLIPIPQSALRRWELFGGSTLRLCEMIRIARKEMGLRTSILDILEARLGANADPADGALSQAKTRGAARYGKAAVFLRRGSGAENPGARLGESRSGPYVIVDDFLTSGSTLRRALAALRSEEGSEKSPFAGAAFDAFVLGFRPSFFTETGTKETEPPSR